MADNDCAAPNKYATAPIWNLVPEDGPDRTGYNFWMQLIDDKTRRMLHAVIVWSELQADLFQD